MSPVEQDWCCEQQVLAARQIVHTKAAGTRTLPVTMRSVRSAPGIWQAMAAAAAVARQAAADEGGYTSVNMAPACRVISANNTSQRSAWTL